jgi:hypothetical protein
MDRRAFLRSGLIIAAAPAIVRAASIMPIYVPRGSILTQGVDVQKGQMIFFSTPVEPMRSESFTAKWFSEWDDFDGEGVEIPSLAMKRIAYE